MKYFIEFLKANEIDFVNGSVVQFSDGITFMFLDSNNDKHCYYLNLDTREFEKSF